MTDDESESVDMDDNEFRDPDETDAGWIRLLAEWFTKGYFPSEDELPVSASWPFGGPEYPWESEDAWALVTDVDRQAFMENIHRILRKGKNR